MEGLPPPPHGASDGWDVERQDGTTFFLTSLLALASTVAIRKDDGLATQGDTDQCVYDEVIPASCQKSPVLSFILTFSNATLPGPIRN